MYLVSFLLIVSIFCVHCRKQDPATLTDRQKRYYIEKKDIKKNMNRARYIYVRDREYAS